MNHKWKKLKQFKSLDLMKSVKLLRDNITWKLENKAHPKILNLSGEDLLSIDLSPISKFPTLEEIDISDNKIQTLDLTPLADCPRLKRLGLNNNLLEVLDLSPLGDCRELEKLNIAKNRLKQISLNPLQEAQNLSVVNLSNNFLESIDLSPLEIATSILAIELSHNNLETVYIGSWTHERDLLFLHLHMNRLTEIDLTSLSTCTELNSLWLGNNNLETIDLQPLSSCKGLRNLKLNSNKLVEVDLTPLEECSELSMLDLSHNQFTFLNLDPLGHCKRLSALNLRNNKLEGLDITPLIGCRMLLWPPIEFRDHVLADPALKHIKFGGAYHHRIDWWDYQKLFEQRGGVYVLERIKTLLEIVGEDIRYHTQRGVIEGFEMSELVGFDGDLLRIIENIPRDDAFQTTRSILYSELMKYIDDQIDSGGPTLFFDIEKMQTLPSATLVVKIVERRKREIEKLHFKEDDVIDLRQLWLTSYGFQVLQALEMGLFTDREGLKDIRSAFIDIGVELQTTIREDPINPNIRLSESMMKYVYEMVDSKTKKKDSS